MNETPDLEIKARVLKALVEVDPWTSHIKMDDSAFLQLASLLDKHFVGKDKGSEVRVGMIRFFVFGWMSGAIMQKWKDEGLSTTKAEEEE